jgi:hypothetical protein
MSSASYGKDWSSPPPNTYRKNHALLYFITFIFSTY